jgi:uncharacterized repeat protein (TIGR04052 family)
MPHTSGGGAPTVPVGGTGEESRGSPRATSGDVTRYLRSWLPVLAVALVGCGDDDDAPSSAAVEPLDVRFEARVGAAPFACGTDYASVGTDGATVTPTDFRLFVHDVRLVGADGRETPLALDDDGLWQGRGVALLDFEDATGGCDTGFTTPEVNTVLRGRAPRGRYTGLRLRVGVPGELNHLDPTSMPAPLNTTQLNWTWNFGYIFLTATAKVVGEETSFDQGVHVGSRGCAGDAQGTGQVVTCQYGNLADVELTNLDLSRPIVLDWGAVFGGLAMRQASDACYDPKKETGVDGPVSCICHTNAPEDRCPALFASLGLDWSQGTADPGLQRVFGQP